jgi:two-component system chemotaxis sensor kinase CheA
VTADNDTIVQDFVVESQEHLADVENDLLAIEAGGAAVDVEVVNRVFRAVHSIKGAAGFLGFTVLGELAHSLENVLNLIRSGDLVPNHQVVDALLRATDALRNLVNNIATSNEQDVSEWVQALAAVVTAETTSETQASMERHVEIQEGQVLFEVSEQLLETHRKMGHRLYLVELDLISDIDDKGRNVLELMNEFVALGEIVEARLDHANWGDLSSAVPDAMRFVALVATVLEDELVSEAFGLTRDQVTAISASSVRVEEAPGPAPAEEPVDAAPPEPDVPAESAPVAAAPAPPEPEAAAPPPPPAVAPPPAPVEDAPAKAPARPADTSIRVGVMLLDHLMNLAGELVLSRNQLLQAVNTGRTEGLNAIASRLDQVTSELQESIMQTRMQPVGTVFGKFPRIVRDLSSKLGKQCELSVDGNEVELDKSICEAIGDPLTHLVRNSVDHGIELPEQRTAAGKPATGRIELRAFHQAGKVNITITDDGAGINVDKVKQKAVENGLLTPDQAREMGPREACQLIFAAGFSTADAVTDVSGRGVGMDVVRTNIEKLGGTVEIDSQMGRGTTMHVKLPLTLAIIPSLVVRCGTERFAVPQVNVCELVRIKATEVAQRIERVKGAEVLRLRGNLLPLVRLSTALGIESQYTDPLTTAPQSEQRVNIADRRTPDLADVAAEEGAEGAAPAPEPTNEQRATPDRRGDTVPGAINVVVVEAGKLRYGMIVDGLHDSEEIVVKPLGRHLKDCNHLAGATILGDGHVALIIDVAGVASRAALSVVEDPTARSTDADGGLDDERQALLLFTNAPNEQFGIPMALIARIERIRVEQIDTVGGAEVLQYRGTTLPLIGLENHIKADPRPASEHYFVAVFHNAGREVGLIVPHLIDIRQVPGNLDKTTFCEPGVLGSAIVDGKTTRLVDILTLTRQAHPEWFGKEAEAGSASGAALRILFAEDSDFFRKQVTSFLENDGYEVVPCEDGAVAWETLQNSETRFDIVLTDIEMPELDGLGLARHIRADSRFAGLPIVAVTSLAGDEDQQRGHEAGIDEYQVKLDRELLLGTLRRIGARVAARPATEA